MRSEGSTPTADESSIRYEGWRVVGASGTALLLTTLLIYSFPILIKPLAEEFGWSRAAASSAYSAMAVMSAVSGAPLGYLVDRVGARIVITACLTLFGALLTSLSLLSAHLWQAYAMFGSLGLFATGASPVTYAKTLSGWFATRRGMALGLAISGSSIGGMMHPPATQALLDAVGWRATYAILGAIVLVTGVPIVATFIRDRRESAARGASMAQAATATEGLTSRVFWILLAVVFCNSLVQSSTLVHVAALLTDRGISLAEAARVLSLFGLASLAGRLITGWLCDRFFATRVSCTLVVSAAAGAVVLSSADSFAAGAVAAMLIGFGTGGETDVAPYLLSRYFGLRSFSTLYGITWMVHALGGATGPILMGRAFDQTGTYETLLVRMAVVAMIVATTLLMLPRYPALLTQESGIRNQDAGLGQA